MLQAIKRGLFREPGHGIRPWIFLLFGGAGIGFFFFALSDPTGTRSLPPLFYLAWGAWALLLAVAELLPRGWTMISGWLRMGGFVAVLSVVLIALFVYPALGRYSSLLTLAVAIWIVLLGVYDLLPDKRTKLANLIATVAFTGMVVTLVVDYSWF